MSLCPSQFSVDISGRYRFLKARTLNDRYHFVGCKPGEASFELLDVFQEGVALVQNLKIGNRAVARVTALAIAPEWVWPGKVVVAVGYSHGGVSFFHYDLRAADGHANAGVSGNVVECCLSFCLSAKRIPVSDIVFPVRHDAGSKIWIFHNGSLAEPTSNGSVGGAVPGSSKEQHSAVTTTMPETGRDLLQIPNYS